MGNTAQAPERAKAQTSPFDRAVDASRAARMAALETARQMRVQAREEMRSARSARKRAAIQNARLQKFVENCKELGIDISGEVEVPRPASQSERTSNNGNHPAEAN